MKRRLFIETDFLQEDELRSAKRDVRYILKDAKIEFSADIFDEVVDFAWQEADKAWEAVLRCDEIYGDSSLVPLSGYGTYTGAPVIFDVMMKKAIEQDVRGKSLILLREYDDIHWEGIDHKLLTKAFKYNSLFTLDEARDNFVKVDIKELIKYIKSKRR